MNDYPRFCGRDGQPIRISRVGLRMGDSLFDASQGAVCMLSRVTLGCLMRWDSDSSPANGVRVEQARALDRFLVDVERRAYRIARVAVRNDDDALDIVQDAMLQLARRYGQRSSDQWRPLFYRILQNRIRDCLRRRKVRLKLFAWMPHAAEDAGTVDPYEGVADAAPQPPQQLATDEAMRVLERALAELPARQQEAFMLRNFEGLDVNETARAMGCGEGSVKTHYSRAIHTLRERLGEVW